MGTREADTDGLADLSKADMRFVSVGAGTTIVSDRAKWKEAKRRMQERAEELRKRGIK